MDSEGINIFGKSVMYIVDIIVEYGFEEVGNFIFKIVWLI